MAITNDSHLARLNKVAVEIYQRDLQRSLEDPDRLEAIYHAQYLAAPITAKLNALCITAKMLTNTVGSAITLVTTTQQHQIGNSDGVILTEDVEVSLCKYVVNEKVPFGISAAETHALVCTSTAVTAKGIHAYLGVPLIGPHSIVLGALCVWETDKNRDWTETDVLMLTGLASDAALMLCD